MTKKGMTINEAIEQLAEEYSKMTKEELLNKFGFLKDQKSEESKTGLSCQTEDLCSRL